jgi:GNAT superfamily N-acetyltransferase
MKEQLSIKPLGPNYCDTILGLVKQLNPNLEEETLCERLEAMFKCSDYKCFGLFEEGHLIGLSGGWTTVRLYAGKQLELDNVIIDNKLQSKGYGKWFFEAIRNWAVENEYESIGLNTYVENHRSHKFYFNEGFKILGFHFEKLLTN